MRFPAAQPLGRAIDQLDAAMAASTAKARCDAVKRAVQQLCACDSALDPVFFEPVAQGYGRRLLYRDPAQRYTVVVMTWARGQGTPLHDHSGMWCVECVFRGKIRVDSYRLAEELPDGRLRFHFESTVRAGVGEAGALIPPFEYHVIANDDEELAATVHVYGGEMSSCSVFEPDSEGLHHRRRRELRYANA
jgi:predicted metal-dependent enzyme (double-stranded beta helix superfamily)